MNVWNKVLMALTGLLCVAFTVLAANKYQLIKENNQKIEQTEKQLAETLDANMKLRYEIYGDPAKEVKGWQDLCLNDQLDYIRNLEAGEMFANCQAIDVKVDEESAASQVSFGVDPEYNMSSFRTGAVVYLFDSGTQYAAAASADGESDGESAAPAADADSSETAAAPVKAPYVFLGAFKVSGANASQVNLESIGFASAAELDKLENMKKSGNSFVACVDRLPIDNPSFIADLYAAQPDLFTAFDAEMNAFLQKRTVDVEKLEAANSDDAAAAVKNIDALFASDLRAPVAYQLGLETQWTARNACNVLMARNNLALKDLNNVIADQLVSLGDKASEGFADALQGAQALVADFQGWDEVFAAAQSRKNVPSFFEQLDSTRANLEKMNGYNALVKSILDEAEENNKLCQEEIDAFIANNAELAAKIAQVQFLLAEKLEKESASRIANEEISSYAGI